jgi:two-component system phosphate regulon sensor histidine kinase PhoR
MPAWLVFVAGAVTLTIISFVPLWLSLILLVAVALVSVLRLLPETESDNAGSQTAATSASARRRISTTEWRIMLDALPDAAILVGHDERVIHHNAMAHELFPRLVAGVALSSRLRHPDLIDAVDAARRQGGAIEVDITDRVPVERRLSARVVRLGTASGSEDGPVLITLRDLSEEDRLARTRADFVANASHELRTPLAAVRGFIETLQGAARNDETPRERFLAMMSTQALRMSRLIDDLLSLSRIEMKQHVPPRDRVDLNEIAAEVAQTMSGLAEQSGSKVELSGLDQPAWVRGDRDELVQAIQNLAQNAIKYGGADGRVGITLTRKPGINSEHARIEIAVSDTGPGIPPQHLPRLTERFYRVNPTTSREMGGTGLGLAIVKHIVNRHRGSLDIRSNLGQGSTFLIGLDALPDSPRKKPNPENNQ